MDKLHGRRVLITGAGGFVGANLTRALIQRGADVHALVRPTTDLWRIDELLPQIALHQIDLTDGQALQSLADEIQPEFIFHLAVSRAAASTLERAEMLQENMLGLLNLLEATASIDYQSFVYTGGSSEYGLRNRALRESDCLDPTTFYGVSKAASTLLCQQFARANQRPIIILRLFSVYGYWEAPTRLIPTTIMAALDNQELALTVPGYRRDFVFVDDVVQACLLAIELDDPGGEIINIGSGHQWTNEEAVATIQTMFDEPIRVRVGDYVAHASDKTHWLADIEKAKHVLGWEPQHTLESGLEKTVAWLRLHQDMYREPMQSRI